MKKLVFAASCLFACVNAHALPVGNPSEASLFLYGAYWEPWTPYDPCDPCFTWIDSWNIRLGFSGDYNFNRHMEVKRGRRGGDIDVTRINTNSGFLVLNFCERVDFFGKLGKSKIHIRTDAVSWGSSTSLESELEFETFLSWSAGGRATLWEWCGFALGVEGEYFQTVPDFDYFLNYATGTLTYFNAGADAFYSEWQIGLGLSYIFSTSCPSFAFVPYAAIKWASAHLELDNFRFDQSGEEFVLHNLKSKKLWGFAVGLSFTMLDMVGVTVEGRWADEKAFHVSGQARF